jgi:hypothetical protein
VYHAQRKNGKAPIPASPGMVLRMRTDTKHPLACAALAAALLAGAAAPAAAQTAPAPVSASPMPGGPMRDGGPMRQRFGRGFAAPNPAGTLAEAYQAIDVAQAVNGRSVYLAQARSHYAGAYARYRRRDARGAGAEAMAAAALAQAAIDARTASAPIGLEPPPGMLAGPAGPAGPARPGPGRRVPLGVQPPAGAPGPNGFGPGMTGPGMTRSGMTGRGSLSSLVAMDPTLEIQTLAERAQAAAAGAARMRASGDPDGAFRFSRLSRDLVRAIHGLVAADQPPRRRGGYPMRRPLGDAGSPTGPAAPDEQDALAP